MTVEGSVHAYIINMLLWLTMRKLVEKTKSEIRYKKYLNLIYKAMTLVGKKYGAIITQYSDNPSKIEICERNYVIFLAFIIGEMQTGNKKQLISDNLYINGEICKQLDIMSDSKIKNAYSEFIKLKKSPKKQKRINIKSIVLMAIIRTQEEQAKIIKM